MKTAKEFMIQKKKDFEKSHNGGQLNPIYVDNRHLEAYMEEYSSLQNRSLVEENEALKARLEKAYDFLEKLSDESGTLLRIRINELLTK